ncbi:hypothetical protein MAR_009957 [Mya arenaria]|uniref:Uncharacterized protein n=2 Tax=Mya arenaria TaxID=6604 RepID=A0ABY7E2G2_MYAAR|nr:hypothetical protein MAR_009957 [Mya arenaria]
MMKRSLKLKTATTMLMLAKGTIPIVLMLAFAVLIFMLYVSPTTNRRHTYNGSDTAALEMEDKHIEQNDLYFDKLFIRHDSDRRTFLKGAIHFVWDTYLKYHSPNTLRSCVNGRFLVYSCTGGTVCGGLADRQRGIISAFLLALLSNRTFVVDMARPCELERFLDPNLYDWTKCKDYIRKLSSKDITTLNYHNERQEFKRLLSINNSNTELFNDTVVKIILNMCALPLFYSANLTAVRMPWLKLYTKIDLINIVYHILFRPGKKLLHDLRLVDQQIAKKNLHCAHIRIGKNPDIPNDPTFVQSRGFINTSTISSFFKRGTDRHTNLVFIAADASHVRKEMTARHEHVLQLNTSIVHIGFSRKTPEACGGFYSAILEQLVLTQCEQLVLTSSGFGSMAAYLRGISWGLFQYNSNRTNDVSLRNSVSEHTLEADMKSHGFFIRY